MSSSILYVREGCHLCDRFLLDYRLDLPEAAAGTTLVDVDADLQSALAYGLRVPVLSIAGRAVCEGAYDCGKVRRALGL